jgi:hypothetical protein
MRATMQHQQGIALLGSMILLLILALLGGMLLNLAGQEALTAAAGLELVMGQHLADAAGDLAVAALNSPHAAPAPLASIMSKRSTNANGAPSFFDANGRSQFIGTSDRPDLLLAASDPTGDRLLNDPESGLFHAMGEFGTIEEFKVYAASRPGLLCTIDATVRAGHGSSLRHSLNLQLAALDVPALRSAVQVGQSLGTLQQGKESPVSVHWGSLKVQGDAVFRRADEVPILSALAPVTGQGYEAMLQREDRWMEGWIGGAVQATEPVTAPVQGSSWPQNLHAEQSPVPGIRLDQWPYDQLKQAAKQFGRYYAIDRDGLLHPQGIIRPGYGIAPDEVLRSQSVGDQRGLIFIDTLDQQAPRSDNLGSVTIRAGYLEGMVVVQGHVLLAPNDGQSLPVLSPPLEHGRSASRVGVQLSHVNINGVVYASGDISVTGRVRLFGSAIAAGSIVPAGLGGTLEVWYNHDVGQGWYQGLPVVYRAPGAWMMRY